MQYAILGLALAGAAYAQGVAKPIFPNGSDGPPTQGTNFPSNAFVLGTQNVGDGQATDGVYDCSSPSYSGAPRISLTGSALTDERGSTGSIVANDQFQFDGPPQNGVKISAGWVRQSNGRLSLGGNDIFYNCLSGDFSNIYRDTQGLQCKQVYITLQTCTSGSKGNVNYVPVKKDGTDQFQIPKVSNDDSIQDDPSKPNLGKAVGGGYVSAAGSSSVASSTAASSSASSSAPASSSAAATTSSAAPSSTLATSTSVAISSTSMPAPPMVMLPPQTQVVNATAPAATGTAPVSTTAGPASTTRAGVSPSPFTNAAPAIAVGQKALALLVVVAGVFALA